MARSTLTPALLALVAAVAGSEPFTKSGSIPQCDYAATATELGCTVVGVCAANGDVALAFRAHDPEGASTSECTVELEWAPFWPLGDGACCGVAGIAGDARYLVRTACAEQSVYRKAHGSALAATALAGHLRDAVALSRQDSGRGRPLATDVLLVGKERSGAVSLHRITPHGRALRMHQAATVGRGAFGCSVHLEQHADEEPADASEAALLALRALSFQDALDGDSDDDDDDGDDGDDGDGHGDGHIDMNVAADTVIVLIGNGGDAPALIKGSVLVNVLSAFGGDGDGGGGARPRQRGPQRQQQQTATRQREDDRTTTVQY